ncbi:MULTISPECIES: hypothetical protein [unclassified Cupriavidus]|uniref:hypothetical protein n=1 Tax=Cupriavidus sp. H19C3 TaxID=3241603 RepID=UPI003BF8449F
MNTSMGYIGGKGGNRRCGKQRCRKPSAANQAPQTKRRKPSAANKVRQTRRCRDGKAIFLYEFFRFAIVPDAGRLPL